MKRALVLMMVLSACVVGDEMEVGDAALAVVLGASTAEPPDPADLLACLDLPESNPLQWASQRLSYHQGCFDSWALNIPIADCEIGGVMFDGTMVYAGDKLASLPATGWLIRARALDKALIDMAELANGQYLDAHVDVTATGDGLTVDACAAPVPGGLVVGAGVEVAIPQLGVIGADGVAQVSVTDDPDTDVIDLIQADYSFAVSAELTDLPAVSGELVGSGIERRDGAWCPDAGQISFTGTVGDEVGWAVLTYVGNGTAEIVLSDGQVLGPYTPPHCSSEGG